MKRTVACIVALAWLIGAGVYYYVNVDKHYVFLHEFNDFPIPMKATLESESAKGNGFIWGKSTGTEVPLGYRIMIKKSGWKQVKMDGHNVIYKKDDKVINLSLANKYIGVLKIEETY